LPAGSSYDFQRLLDGPILGRRAKPASKHT
jgi:hypothetical protein